MADNCDTCCGQPTEPELTPIELEQKDPFDPNLLTGSFEGLPVDNIEVDVDDPYGVLQSELDQVVAETNQVDLSSGTLATIPSMQKGLNYALLKTLGLGDALVLTDEEKRIMDGEAYEEDNVDQKETIIGAGMVPPIVGDPPSPTGVLTEAPEFGSGPFEKTLEELWNTPYDKDTKMNIISDTGASTTFISHAVVVESDAEIIGDQRMSGLRDALNRSKATEGAVKKLFDLLGYEYNTKITLSELLLDAAGMKRNTPIDPFVLYVLNANLGGKVSFNTAYIMMTMGGIEPQGPAIAL
jgi:hypothetical protein